MKEALKPSKKKNNLQIHAKQSFKLTVQSVCDSEYRETEAQFKRDVLV